MPAPKIPTTTEIYDRIISDIESKLNQTTPLLFKAFNRVIAMACAGVFTILYKYGQWVLKQIFTITQDQDNLELKGEQYDIPRKSSTTAVLSVDFTGDNNTVIPAGRQFRSNSNGLLYSVNEEAEILTGTIGGEITCLTPGSTGNLIDGSLLTILKPIAGLDNLATVTATTTEAEDQEDIEVYRARIQDREKLPPQGGSLVDYVTWSKEFPGITRAFAWGHREVPAIPPGYVSVYPISDDDDDGRIPTTEKLEEVHDYIDDPTRAPMQVVVINVLPMTELSVDIIVTALEPNTSEIRNRFAENVAECLLGKEPNQFENQLNENNVISRAGIESVYINSGAKSVSLTINHGTGATESYTLKHNELAILGDITNP